MIRPGRMIRVLTLAAAFSSVYAFDLAAQQKPPAPPPPKPSGLSAAQLFQKGEELYQDGKWAEALERFTQFEKEYPFSTTIAQAVYYQGWCWLSMGRYEEAAAAFERITKNFSNSPVFPDAMIKLAECRGELKDYAKALELYRFFQQTYPRHQMTAQAMLGEAWMTYKQSVAVKDSNPEEFAKALQTALALAQQVRARFGQDSSANLDALFLMAQIVSEEKRYDQAKEIYKEIAKRRNTPRATAALYLAGETMFTAKKYEDAINYFERVQPKAVILANIQAEIEIIRSAISRQPESRMFFLSQIEALKRMATQVQSQPEFRALALFRIATCYQFLNKPEEASIVYRRFLTLFPDDRLGEQAHFGLIVTLAARGQNKQSIEEKEAFKKKYPGSKLLDEAEFVEAQNAFATGDFETALSAYQRVLTASKDDKVIQSAEFYIGLCYINLDKLPEALNVFRTFAEKHPQSESTPDALFRIGRIHFELSQRAEKAGNAEERLKQLAAAAEAFEKLRKDYKDHKLAPDVTFQLGYLYVYQAGGAAPMIEKAIATFREFVTNSPDYKNAEGRVLAPEAFYQIGQCHFALSQPTKAIEAYNQIIADYPTAELAPFAAFEIASMYAAQDDIPKTIAALRSYVEKYPDHSNVGKALHAIAGELEKQAAAMEQRDPAGAKKILDQAIAEYQGLIRRAVAADEKNTDLRHAAIDAQIRIAKLLSQRGENDAAVADCEEFLSKFEKDTLAVRAIIGQIVEIYSRGRRFKDAHEKLESISTRYQQNAAVRVATATAQIDLGLAEGNFAAANIGAAKLLADPERDRLPASSYLSMGGVFIRTGRSQQAIDVFQKILTQYKDDTQAIPLATLGLGQAHFDLGKYDIAEGHLTKYLEMAAADPRPPGLADARLTLAKIYLKTNRTKNAVDLLNALLTGRGSTVVEAAFLLGNYFYELSDPVKLKDNHKLALAYYTRVMLVNQEAMGELAQFRAAQCHETLGNREAACSVYRAYLKRFATGKYAEEAKARSAIVCAPPK